MSVKWIIIDSGNGLSPVRRQAFTWTTAGLLSIRLLGTGFSKIWMAFNYFHFKKMLLKMSSAKWWPFCPWGYELIKFCWMPLLIVMNKAHQSQEKTREIAYGSVISDCSLSKCLSTLIILISVNWGWEKMTALFQAIFSNAFSWINMEGFCLRLHQILFLRFELIIFHHWVR